MKSIKRRTMPRVVKRAQSATLTAAGIILKTIAILGENIPEMIAPNARKNFKLFRQSKMGKTATPFYINQTVKRFIRMGLVQIKIRRSESYICLTDKGRQRLLKYQMDDLASGVRQGTWDGRWRVIIFDISEEKRFLRDMLRRNLVDIGFERLQNSVWIYPYECEELIHLIKTDSYLGDNVIYMTVDKLENGERFQKLFGIGNI